jgi:hypothetical protein
MRKSSMSYAHRISANRLTLVAVNRFPLGIKAASANAALIGAHRRDVELLRGQSCGAHAAKRQKHSEFHDSTERRLRTRSAR